MMFGREKRVIWWLWAAAIMLLLGGMACCAGGPPPPSREEERMLALLSMARSRHRLATIASQQGQHDKALQHVDQILQLHFPRGFRPGEEMLLDAWARKAKMQLQLKRPKDALSTIEAAIQRPTWLKNSFYIAHLHQVKGQILEALQQPKQAVKAYQRSILLNQAVIREIEQERKRQNRGQGGARP